MASTRTKDAGDRPGASVVAANGARGAAGAALGEELGLTRDDLLRMYSLIAVTRAIDERMWILNRAGKVAFVISGQGHEGAQVGIAYSLR